MCLVGVVVRRYIYRFPLVSALFAAASLLFVIFNVFRSLEEGEEEKKKKNAKS